MFFPFASPRPLCSRSISSAQSAPDQREWRKAVESATSEWMKNKQRVPVSRNVGGTCKKKWTHQEDLSLDLAVRRLGTDSWRHVAILVRGRSSKQCRERWLAHFAPEIAHDDWTPEEDLTLVERQRELGNQWVRIKTFLPRRSLVAVKNRWNWLSRRDIPNHSREFQEMVESYGKPEDQREGGEADRGDQVACEDVGFPPFQFSSDLEMPLFEF